MSRKSAIGIIIVLSITGLFGAVYQTWTPGFAEARAAEAEKPETAAGFHIGVMTGSAAQSEDELRGAEAMIRLYGEASRGGMVRHVTYPDNFMTEVETTIARISELANDPLMKLIVVTQGVPGTTEAFRMVKKKRPDIICLTGEAHEDPIFVASVADLAVNSDFLSRGYLIPHSARELGAKTLVHISFPRHMIDEPVSRRRAIMEEACRDLGLKFVYENAPDPTGQAGLDGARRFIMEQFPVWIEQYGPETAFFCTNDAHTEPLLRQIAAYGGYFVEQDTPSPLLGYPGAFGLDVRSEIGNWPAILQKIEGAVVKAGSGGRMGTWAYSLGYAHVAGLVEFGKRVVEGRAKLSDTKTLIECYDKFSPGARWKTSSYMSPLTGQPVANYFLIYQDTYVLGRGYLSTTGVAVPHKYLNIQLPERKTAPFHIGLVTGHSQSDDDFLGAKEMLRLYGDVTAGGLVRHVIYPDNFMDEMETTIAEIAALADDPLMKVIVVNQAVPGTAEGFRRVKAKRPDIVCLAGEAHEPMDTIASIADLVVNSDFISRGYLIPHSARELGAKTFVHISFPRHMGYKYMARRYAIMKQACTDLGLKFVSEEAPDPTGEAGLDSAQQFILEKVPLWLKQYGRDTAFFCTNDAHTAPLLRQIAAYGGYFVEADVPSPFMGYPEAFKIDLQRETGDWPKILKKVEDSVAMAEGSGRLGTWAYSLGFCQSAGLAEFGKLIAEGRARISDTKTLLECFGKFSSGVKWNGTYYTDAVTGKPIRNYFLIYQDTYILGRGYLGVTSVEIPEKYLMLGDNP